MKKLLLILTVLFIVACNPSRRINRIAEKYNLKKTETVYVNDTVRVPGDSIEFGVPVYKDTFFVQDGVTIESLATNDSILYIRITTPPDTIIKQVPVTVEKIVTKEVPKRNRINWWLFAIALIFIAYGIYAGNLNRD